MSCNGRPGITGSSVYWPGCIGEVSIIEVAAEVVVEYGSLAISPDAYIFEFDSRKDVVYMSL